MEFVTVTPMDQSMMCFRFLRQATKIASGCRSSPTCSLSTRKFAACRNKETRWDKMRQDETRWDKMRQDETRWDKMRQVENTLEHGKKMKKVAAPWTLCHLTNPCCTATLRSLLTWHCFVLGEKSLMLATAEVQPKVNLVPRSRSLSHSIIHQLWVN